MNDDDIRLALDTLVGAWQAGDLVLPDGDPPRIVGHPECLPAFVGMVYGGIVVVRLAMVPIGNLYILPASQVAAIEGYLARMEC